MEGTARVLEERFGRLPGADLLVVGDVPVGAGLSSSASLEMSVALALASLAGWALDRRALARAGQEAEHRFVGARCGIMDQLVSHVRRGRPRGAHRLPQPGDPAHPAPARARLR